MWDKGEDFINNTKTQYSYTNNKSPVKRDFMTFPSLLVTQHYKSIPSLWNLFHFVTLQSQTLMYFIDILC